MDLEGMQAEASNETRKCPDGDRCGEKSVAEKIVVIGKRSYKVIYCPMCMRRLGAKRMI